MQLGIKLLPSSLTLETLQILWRQWSIPECWVHNIQGGVSRSVLWGAKTTDPQISLPGEADPRWNSNPKRKRKRGKNKLSPITWQVLMENSFFKCSWFKLKPLGCLFTPATLPGSIPLLGCGWSMRKARWTGSVACSWDCLWRNECCWGKFWKENNGIKFEVEGQLQSFLLWGLVLSKLGYLCRSVLICSAVSDLASTLIDNISR